MSQSLSAPSRDLVVIGASAGGIEALQRIAGDLPANLPAAVCIAVHVPPDTATSLDEVISRAGALPAREDADGVPLRNGEILVAPPDRHLVIEDGRARLSIGPRENGHRPAIDVLFRSAADARDGRAVGVILSGALDDGAAGLAAIRAAGGAAVVQDPEDALFPQMPTSAIPATDVDAIVTAPDMAEVLEQLVRQTIDPRRKLDMPQTPLRPSQDRSVASVCPDCGGLLTEDAEAPILQWTCNVGHRYSAASLADAQGARVEDQIWAVVRSLEDRSKLLERMAEKQEGPGREAAARLLRQRAQEAAEHAELVRELRHRVTATTLQPVDRRASDPVR